MADYNCIYCGSSDIKELAPNEAECLHCGFSLTREEIEKAKKQAKATPKHKNRSDADKEVCEEKILASAWELMQEQTWDRALDLLFPPVSPAASPVEFAVYRHICQICRIYEKDDLATRYFYLDTLRHNLERIGYFLSAKDEESSYKILERLHRALMLLGITVLPCSTRLEMKTENKTIPAFADYTNQKRSDILECFANRLRSEEYENSRHRTEYLTMAVGLLHQCLHIAREKHYRLIYSVEDERVLQITPETRRRIKAAINGLNAEISALDPQFVPMQPLPDPKMVSGKLFLGGLFLTLFLGLTAALIYYLGSPDSVNRFFCLLTSSTFQITVISVTAVAVILIYVLNSND